MIRRLLRDQRNLRISTQRVLRQGKVISGGERECGG